MDKRPVTSIISRDPLTVYHAVPEFTDEAIVRKRVEDALAVIETCVKNDDRFNLLLDFRNFPHFKDRYSMAAHRVWSTGFKDSQNIRKNVDFTAVLGKESPQFKMEQQFMESYRFRFFTSPDEAAVWLGIPAIPEIKPVE